MELCKILIADDEKLAREAIKLQLAGKQQVSIVAECADGSEAVNNIQKLRPDIIFMDIQMPVLTGFEVLQALPSDYSPYLIIATAHDNYALMAYEHDALDYLVKPFTDARFNKAFQKAFGMWEQNKAQGQVKAMQTLSERMQKALSQSNTHRVRITVKDGAKLFVIACDDILFIEAKGDYTAIQTKEKKYLHSESLTALEALLDPAAFTRIHRSSIVNIHFIKELSSHYNGDYTVILHNGQTLKLSRSYREQLLQKIG